MRFCYVRCTPQVVPKISEISFKNRPKIHSESPPEAFQNDLQKNEEKKHRKITIFMDFGLQVGGPRGSN